jgi:uncharacterized protein YukE
MNIEILKIEAKIAERALIVYVTGSAIDDEDFPEDYIKALKDEIENHNTIIAEYQEQLNKLKQDRKDKFEGWAKKWESKVPNLAKALRSDDLQNSTADIEMFDGWIKVSTSTPKDDENVLVTDGKDVWIGDYNSKRHPRDGKWAVVYNGAPPFDSTKIIAWTFFPSVPPELNEQKQANGTE